MIPLFKGRGPCVPQSLCEHQSSRRFLTPFSPRIPWAQAAPWVCFSTPNVLFPRKLFQQLWMPHTSQKSPAQPTAAWSGPYFWDETPHKVQSLGFCGFITPGAEGQQLLLLEPQAGPSATSPTSTGGVYSLFRLFWGCEMLSKQAPLHAQALTAAWLYSVP